MKVYLRCSLIEKISNIIRQINPLEASSAAKHKSKDIHLPSIDVNFGSNRILCVLHVSSSIRVLLADPASSSGASLTLAHGRRYGLIGRNGGFVTPRVGFSLKELVMITRCW